MDLNSPLQQRIIGLYSPVPRSGKTSVYRMLDSRGFQRVSFADTLKSMAYGLLVDLGYDSKQAYGLITDNKSELISELGVTARHLLQTLGTEWGRNCIHPNIWLKCWESRVAGIPKAVVDDVRFPNEAALIKNYGGQIWRIERPGLSSEETNHASEGGLEDWDFDAVIVNDDSLATLAERVYATYQQQYPALQPSLVA